MYFEGTMNMINVSEIQTHPPYKQYLFPNEYHNHTLGFLLFYNPKQTNGKTLCMKTGLIRTWAH